MAESVGPIFIVCVAPFVWTALVFMAGRWSAGHAIRIEKRSTTPTNKAAAQQNAYYDREDVAYG